MNFIKLFKREKEKNILPSPQFDDNWKQDKFEKNVKEGVFALKNGKSVIIEDDGRGYELALQIKHKFILEYQKQLSEKIKIIGNSIITISLNN